MASLQAFPAFFSKDENERASLTSRHTRKIPQHMAEGTRSRPPCWTVPIPLAGAGKAGVSCTRVRQFRPRQPPGSGSEAPVRSTTGTPTQGQETSGAVRVVLSLEKRSMDRVHE
ncbi:unnamed protein product [Ectocarpus sp. 12 AP-2014]